MASQWEYSVLTYTTGGEALWALAGQDDVSRSHVGGYGHLLADLGAEGWEAFGFSCAEIKGDIVLTWTFKRPTNMTKA